MCVSFDYINDFEDFAVKSKSKCFLLFSHSKGFGAGHLSNCTRGDPLWVFNQFSQICLQSSHIPGSGRNIGTRKIAKNPTFAQANTCHCSLDKNKCPQKNITPFFKTEQNIIEYLPEKLPERMYDSFLSEQHISPRNFSRSHHFFWALVHLPGHNYEASGNCDGGLHPLV